ncbi:MAG: hypothetical protein QOE41_1722 [Mycobacterium sp.]|jgi:hypothetical protein|nr:hypothetical protein [Mycobacterium sp.]MDT5132411.1 hypothetical protein [Mycobacterium sp.]
MAQPDLQRRLKSVLDGVVRVTEEDDGALTVRHDGTLASLRVVSVAEDLDLVSLSQILAWDLSVDRQVRAQIAEYARETMLGTVALVEKKRIGEVMLHYNFPGNGLTDGALRTLILMVLSTGADVRRGLTA